MELKDVLDKDQVKTLNDLGLNVEYYATKCICIVTTVTKDTYMSVEDYYRGEDLELEDDGFKYELIPTLTITDIIDLIPHDTYIPMESSSTEAGKEIYFMINNCNYIGKYQVVFSQDFDDWDNDNDREYFVSNSSKILIDAVFRTFLWGIEKGIIRIDKKGLIDSYCYSPF